MIKKKLLQDKALLQKQIFWLRYSLDECQAIGIKKEYSIEEFGRFETLCSRFARSIDFLIRKVWRTIDIYEFEDFNTFIDIVNNAHKREFFEDIDELRLMKDLRNTIVHEYIEEELQDIFDEVLLYGKKLLIIMENTLKYIENLRI